jgi:hypothetical protein
MFFFAWALTYAQTPALPLKAGLLGERPRSGLVSTCIDWGKKFTSDELVRNLFTAAEKLQWGDRFTHKLIHNLLLAGK